jgi:cellulose biosynthesis protein BcsQ
MKVCFLSSARGQTGTSTAALLTGMFLSTRYAKDIGFIPVTPSIDDILHYCDIEPLVNTDITRSIAQLHKLLQMNEMKPADLKTYATPVANRFDLFNLTDETVGEEEILSIQKHLINNMPYDHVIVDVEYPWDHPFTQACVEACDLVVIGANQNILSLDALAKMRESEWLKDKLVLVVINNYNSAISSQDKVLKHPSLPKRQTFFFHYNPKVMQFMNRRQTIELVHYIHIEDILVLELTEDLCRFCDNLAMHAGDIDRGKNYRVKREAKVQKRGFKL